VRVDAGRADVTDALRAHLRRLGDHKAGTGALRIIGGGERMSDLASTPRLRVIGDRTKRSSA
jgi:hypothetical protein